MKNVVLIKFFLCILANIIHLCNVSALNISNTLSSNDTNVSTSIEKKNVLLDEFTAIRCSLCPGGHEISKNLHGALHEKMSTICFHVSSLAVPSGNDPDFRTTYGDSIFSLKGGGGMPSGGINRHEFPNCIISYGLSLSDWSTTAKAVVEEDAIANIYAKSTIDTIERTLSIDIEIFYTQTPEKTDFNLLNIAITEDNIKGSQSGHPFGLSYTHKHVFRDFALGLWGDTVKVPQKGMLFKKTYTYDIPAMYANRAPNLNNLSIVAFISEDKKDILNSVTNRPDIIQGRYVTDNAKIEIYNMTKQYAYNYFMIDVDNLGSEPIESLTFKTLINGITKDYTVSNLNIRGLSDTVINLFVDEIELKNVNIYRITLIKINGKDVSIPHLDDNYYYPTILKTNTLKIKFISDKYGDENMWFIKDRNGNILKQAGPFEKGIIKEYTDSFELESNKVYSFELIDTWNDGVDYDGGFELIDGNDDVIYRQDGSGMYGAILPFIYKDATSSERENKYEELKVQLSPNPCKDELELKLTNLKVGYANIEIFSFNGTKILERQLSINASEEKSKINLSDLNKGIYFIKITNGNNIILEKIIKY